MGQEVQLPFFTSGTLVWLETNHNSVVTSLTILLICLKCWLFSNNSTTQAIVYLLGFHSCCNTASGQKWLNALTFVILFNRLIFWRCLENVALGGLCNCYQLKDLFEHAETLLAIWHVFINHLAPMTELQPQTSFLTKGSRTPHPAPRVHLLMRKTS